MVSFNNSFDLLISPLLKTATGADFRASLKNGALFFLSSRILLGSIVLLFLLSNSNSCLAQSSIPEKIAPCQQLFLLKIEKSLVSLDGAKIDSAFYRNGFTISKTDFIAGTIKLSCPKGCSVDNVKKVLDDLKLNVIGIKEEYTNRPIPKIFQ